MGHPHGIPLWYELMTDDPDAAEAFYRTVLGWTFSQPPGGLSRGYRLGLAAEVPVVGILPRPDGAPVGNSWLIYFGADDPDATARKAEAKGGRIYMPGTDIAGVGLVVLVADPQGIPFYLMRSPADDFSSFMQVEQAVPGHAVWNELTSPDPAAAIAFYQAILGFDQEGSMPMGELGEYQFLHVGDTNIGAVMGEVPNGRRAWQVYFLVPDVDEAATRLAEAGGKVLQGPDEIPGGAFSIVAEDSKAIRFGLVGRRAT